MASVFCAGVSGRNERIVCILCSSIVVAKEWLAWLLMRMICRSKDWRRCGRCSSHTCRHMDACTKRMPMACECIRFDILRKHAHQQIHHPFVQDMNHINRRLFPLCFRDEVRRIRSQLSSCSRKRHNTRRCIIISNFSSASWALVSVCASSRGFVRVHGCLCVFTFFLPYVLLCASASLCESACVSFNVSTCVCMSEGARRSRDCLFRSAPEAISIETEAEQAKKTGKGKKGKPTAAALTRGSLFVSFFNLKALNLDLYP